MSKFFFFKHSDFVVLKNYLAVFAILFAFTSTLASTQPTEMVQLLLPFEFK